MRLPVKGGRRTFHSVFVPSRLDSFILHLIVDSLDRTLSTVSTPDAKSRCRNDADHVSPQPATTNSSNEYSRTFTLNTGAKIPAVGLGTWKSGPNEVSKAVEAALRTGYRHIDTALAYGNEREVGEGIRASGVPRDQIWLTTKLDNPWHKRVPEGIASSLESLGTDYVDLYLMHWPSSSVPEDLKQHYSDWDFRDTWREMQKLVETGKVKNIGVSNFGIKNLEKLFASPDFKVSLLTP